MARLLLVLLIVAGILMLQIVADKSEANPVGVKSESEQEPYGVVSGVADQPASSVSNSESSSVSESRAAEAPEIRRLGKHHQSVAGGGVIIGGLVSASFAAVFCYIRVTRKRNGATATN